MSHRVAPVLLVALAAGLACPAAAEIRAQPRATFELGVDSFAQVYRLTDFADETLLSEETTLRTETDVFTEWRGAAELGLRIGPRERTVDVRTRLSHGTDTTRGDATVDVDLRGSRHRLDVRLDVEGRRFRDDSDYALNSDLGEGRFRGHWQWTAREGWDLGLRMRGDATRYDRPSEFEIDNERIDVALTSAIGRGLGEWFDLEFGAARRSVDGLSSSAGDSLAPGVFAYASGYGRVEWVHDDAGPWRLRLGQWAERRVYDDEAQRSALWNLALEPEVRLRLDDEWELRWRSVVEWLDYDDNREAYFDLALGRTGLGLVRRWGTWEASVEPRLGWLRAPVANADEYVQPSLVLGLDGFGGDRFYLSISEEVGHRDYREIDDGLDLYTDYWFLRSTVLGSLRVTREVSLELFVSDEPESHRDEADDARLTLVTATLRVRF